MTQGFQVGSKRHKVFVSYYHDEDQEWRDRFEKLFAEHFDILVPKSVQLGSIPSTVSSDETRRQIREKHINDSTVTVVLIGNHTWQRKFVDWEIYMTLRTTPIHPRGGLLGLLLPTRADYKTTSYDPSTIPQRLHMNIVKNYAKVYDWFEDPKMMLQIIDEAYKRRDKIDPDNSLDQFGKNHTGERWQW